jgi:di/tricarboxylate transporter
MNMEQILASALVALALGLFAWGRWRYDVVALIALLAGVFTGVIPATDAFLGFGHAAVVTVAAVLIISRALAVSGAVDIVASTVLPKTNWLSVHIAVLCIVSAFFSAFMSNTGTLALIMPVAIAAASKSGHNPAAMLMPISFASMLGGMTTLIGTPSNIIVAAYRAKTGGDPFALFDFSPVGGAVALAGLVFIVLIGWRLVPQRGAKAAEKELGVGEYLTEMRIPETNELIGKSLSEVEALIDKNEAVLLSVIRGKRQIPTWTTWERLQSDDVLILEASPDSFKALLENLKLELIGDEKTVFGDLRTEELDVSEVVVPPNALIVGLTAEEIRLRSRYLVNLLAVARQGTRYRGRLRTFRFQAGDVLLLRGPIAQLRSAVATLGCLPLAEREIRIGRGRRALLASTIVVAALAATAFSLLSAPVALVLAVAGLLMSNVLRLREAYEAIDGSILVLLGAMLPVGFALENTGTTQLAAAQLLALGQDFPPVAALSIVLVATMLLTDLVNNAAAAVMMAPLAVSIAQGLGVNSDAFLMAVAIGSSCSFLTPIGHQNNTLVMGPGGYRFWDYWRLGLPLAVVVAVVSVPVLLVIWPL